MARLNTYTRTSQPSDSDVFVIDSTTGSAGTRTVLWSSIRSLFAAAKHSHAASDITSGTLAVDRLPTIPLSKGGTGATSAATARTALGVQNPITSANALTNQNLNSYNSVEQCGWYYAADGNSVTNKPSGVDHFGMFVMQTAMSAFSQILYDNGNKIWTRSYSNSSWSSWTALVRTTDTIPKATQSADGLMSSADKRKLDGLSGDYASAIGLATSSKDGLMSKTDKAKLDAIGSISNSTIDGFFRI
jgi:hypothetical protein